MIKTDISVQEAEILFTLQPEEMMVSECGEVSVVLFPKNDSEESDIFPYFPRNVEPTLEESIIDQAPRVVLVRGRRRVGKSTTTKHILRKRGKVVCEIKITPNDESILGCLEEFLATHPQLPEQKIVNIWSCKRVFVELLKRDVFVVFEEIQNASSTLQLLLQSVMDDLAYSLRTERWTKGASGSVVLMGSLPNLVDALVESRKAPLFQRIHSRITILPFDTSEICSVFDRLRLKSASLRLFLHTLTGGMPFLLELLHQGNLLSGDDTEQTKSRILKEIYASELSLSSLDACQFFKDSLGFELSTALSVLPRYKSVSEQKKEIAKKLSVDGSKRSDQAAWDLLNELHHRYGIAQPVYSITSGNLVKYEISDSFHRVSQQILSLPHAIQEGVDRNFHPDAFLRVTECEGLHFEEWVREIIEDLYLLKRLSLPGLPSYDGDVPVVVRNLCWDNDCEIDVLFYYPQKETLIAGSCKRQRSKLNLKNLKQHVQKCFANGTPKGLRRFKIPENVKSVQYVLFYAIDDQPEQIDPKALVLSLEDLLSPFFSQ